MTIAGTGCAVPEDAPGNDPNPPVVIIPAYQPNRALIGIVDNLLGDPHQVVIVVDDGSSADYQPVFRALSGRPRVHLLRHAVNLGKGQALKTAFNHFLTQLPATHAGVVTVDADGQHLVEDVRRVAAVLARDSTQLVLGSRSLRGDVPWKSALGNRLTTQVFHRLLGRRLDDTQTGLRGIPRAYLSDLLRIPANGYEFELEMLVRAVHRNLTIIEVPIRTVYEDGNKGSHFDPLRDSLKIYYVFVRFLLLSLATAALDFVVFAAAYRLSGFILLSTATARVVAGSFNFYFARKSVFRSKGSRSRELVAYVGLVLWLMMLSYAVLTGLVIFLKLNVYVSKVVAETTLFLASFAVQRLFVFSRLQPNTDRPPATDWNAYYRRPLRQAHLTRRITTRVLLRLMRRYAPEPTTSICELGGANSCFYSAVRAAFENVDYYVIDNNVVGLELLQERCCNDRRLKTCCDNVLTMPDATVRADIVYSVGLVEHFSPGETATVIRKHFSCVRPGGTVIITFPTPTWLYRATRYLAELLGVWRFPDERPLHFEEVHRELRQHGSILDSRINWPIVLTQGIVVVRAW